MLTSTLAVCIKSFPYKESSTVVSLYTKDSGLKTCIINGGRKPNAKVKSACFQPLQPMEVVIYNNPKSAFCRIKENKLTFNIAGIQTNMTKISVAMFITEVFYLSVKEDNPNEELFFFLENSVIYINNCEKERDLRDFHIYFLYHLSRILGFEPMNNYSLQTPFFDISKGTFVEHQDVQTLDKDLSSLFYKTLLTLKSEYAAFTENSAARNALLDIFILFFEQHITNNRRIKSRQILHTIF